VKTLYVANLPYSVTETELAAEFGKLGKVTKVSLAKHRDTGKPRGFAFIVMEHGADAAIDELNGKHCFGRILTCSEARPRN
jgi:cold-inducible RNA-binding protein